MTRKQGRSDAAANELLRKTEELRLQHPRYKDKLEAYRAQRRAYEARRGRVVPDKDAAAHSESKYTI